VLQRVIFRRREGVLPFICLYAAALSADAFFIGQWSFVIDAWEIQFNDSHDQMTGEELPVADGISHSCSPHHPFALFT
jgi:hypothetical protein